MDPDSWPESEGILFFPNDDINRIYLEELLFNAVDKKPSEKVVITRRVRVRGGEWPEYEVKEEKRSVAWLRSFYKKIKGRDFDPDAPITHERYALFYDPRRGSFLCDIGS